MEAGAEMDRLVAEALIVDPANVTKRPPATEYSGGTTSNVGTLYRQDAESGAWSELGEIRDVKLRATASNAPPGWAERCTTDWVRAAYVDVEFGRAFHPADLFNTERVNCVDTSPCRGCGVHFRAQDLTAHMSGCEEIRRLDNPT